MTITKIWCLAALAAAFAAPVNAAPAIDTGVPDGSGFPLSLDSNDWLAGQVTFTSAVQVNAINVYLDDIGNGAGTFTLALYADDSVKHLPENLLNSVSATFTHAGWNGAANLDWSVGLGTYWIAIEGQDPFNGGFVGVMPVGAPAPLTHTAFNDGSGYRSADGLSFGLHVEVDTVAAIPEPAIYAMLLAGLGLLGWKTRRIGNGRSRRLGLPHRCGNPSFPAVIFLLIRLSAAIFCRTDTCHSSCVVSSPLPLSNHPVGAS